MPKKSVIRRIKCKGLHNGKKKTNFSHVEMSLFILCKEDKILADKSVARGFSPITYYDGNKKDVEKDEKKKKRKKISAR